MKKSCGWPTSWFNGCDHGVKIAILGLSNQLCDVLMWSFGMDTGGCGGPHKKGGNGPDHLFKGSIR